MYLNNFKNASPVSQRVSFVRILKTNWLMLAKGISAARSENGKELIYTLCGRDSDTLALNQAAHM
jgi:hypothetical protein